MIGVADAMKEKNRALLTSLLLIYSLRAQLKSLISNTMMLNLQILR